MSALPSGSTVKVLPYQKLQRHQPAELRVLGFVHYTHTTASELFQDAVVRNGLANHASNLPLRAILGRVCRQVNARRAWRQSLLFFRRSAQGLEDHVPSLGDFLPALRVDRDDLQVADQAEVVRVLLLMS